MSRAANANAVTLATIAAAALEVDVIAGPHPLREMRRVARG